jgi:hypothetical protein
MAKYIQHRCVSYKHSKGNLKLINKVLYNYAQNLEHTSTRESIN